MFKCEPDHIDFMGEKTRVMPAIFRIVKHGGILTAAIAVALLAMTSCNKDHKEEAVSNYLRFIWRINSDQRLQLLTVNETRVIKGRDSLDILVRKFSEGEKKVLTADSLIAIYEKDDAYNSNLLKKTEARIDSFKKVGAGLADNSFFVEYTKSLVQLRDFTASQLAELRVDKYLLEKYKRDPDEILSHQVQCRYRIRKEAPDTTSRIYSQIFYLSGDTKRVLAVVQDSSFNKKPGPQ